MEGSHFGSQNIFRVYGIDYQQNNDLKNVKNGFFIEAFDTLHSPETTSKAPSLHKAFNL